MSNKELWLKELAKIQRRIKRLEKRGYSFPEYSKPELPKRVTQKELERMRTEYTPQKLYKQAEYKTKAGETVSGYQGRKLERQESARKGQATKRKRAYQKQIENAPRISSVMYSNLREFLSQLSTVQYKGIRRGYSEVIYEKKESAIELLSLLDSTISTEGEQSVFTRLEAQATELQSAMNDLYLASTQEQVNASSVRIATIIKGESLTLSESESFTEINEGLESIDIV